MTPPRHVWTHEYRPASGGAFLHFLWKKWALLQLGGVLGLRAPFWSASPNAEPNKTTPCLHQTAAAHRAPQEVRAPLILRSYSRNVADKARPKTAKTAKTAKGCCWEVTARWNAPTR